MDLSAVDQGTTVTDFLPLEKERGITVASACANFTWNDAKVNLIDTPGHYDFNFEVERALSVLDGTVTILDGNAGVQAQTEVVWKQASRRKIPSIIFVNKLDRHTGDFISTARHTLKKLNRMPMIIQLPIYSASKTSLPQLLGYVDIVTMTQHSVVPERAAKPISEADDEELYNICIRARQSLIELAWTFDDQFLLEHSEFSPKQADFAEIIKPVLRKISIQSLAVPMICGSAGKGIGVEAVLDAVVDYLPNPSSPVPINADKTKIVASVFKIIHNARKKPLAYIRVYQGTLRPQSSLFNLTTGKVERISRIYQSLGAQTIEVPELRAGEIGLVLGTTSSGTGDVISSTRQLKDLAMLQLQKCPAAFVCSAEVDRIANEKALDEALCGIELEDPSFSWRIDNETNQRLVAGIGELHLQVILERLRTVWRVNVTFGKAQVVYRETVTGASSVVGVTQTRSMSNETATVGIRIMVEPIENASSGSDSSNIPAKQNVVRVLPSDFSEHLIDARDLSVTGAELRPGNYLYDCLNMAFLAGPLTSSPVCNVRATAQIISINGRNDDYSPFSPETTSSGSRSNAPNMTAAMRSAIYGCVKTGLAQAMKEAGIQLLEPMTQMTIETDEKASAKVISMLTSRTLRGNVVAVDRNGSR